MRTVNNYILDVAKNYSFDKEMLIRHIVSLMWESKLIQYYMEILAEENPTEDWIKCLLNSKPENFFSAVEESHQMLESSAKSIRAIIENNPGSAKAEKTIFDTAVLEVDQRVVEFFSDFIAELGTDSEEK